MMNWIALQDLARERSRDMIADAANSRQHVAREESLAAEEAVYLYGESALLINARVRAQAAPRVSAAAL
jgi:hypothetical protein